MKLKVLLVAAMLASGAAPAFADQASVSISSKATYEDALACRQYYAAGADLARQLERKPETSADQAAGFQLQAIYARQLRDIWMTHVVHSAGARTAEAIESDMRRQGDAVIADGNAALAGDKAAAERGRGRSVRCGKLEVVAKAG